MTGTSPTSAPSADGLPSNVVTIDQLTEAINQMGAAMSAALSQGLASSRSDGVSSVKVEVFRCKEDSRTKVLDAIQLARTTAKLQGFGEAFNEPMTAKLCL